MIVGRLRCAAVAGVLLAMCAATSASAEVRIQRDFGGQIGPYLYKYAMVREAGQRVVIDGPCLSACTLVLSVVPSERICVTRRAVLGFHAARSIDRRGKKGTPDRSAPRCAEAGGRRDAHHHSGISNSPDASVHPVRRRRHRQIDARPLSRGRT